ncbi:MAG: transposase [Chloroflexi bacterium]|nr:transposase [Chloroflexota bacterium]
MSFRPQHDPAHLYFITATLLGWKPLFAQPAYTAIVLGALDWHRRHGRWNLFAFVVMPTHIHAIIKPLTDHTISTVLQSFGSFTAHAILRQLKHERNDEWLVFFSHRQDQDTDKQHQIWQPIQAKNVFSPEFLREKLEYVHNNPTAKKWSLVRDRADYAYSSACFYDRGAVPAVEVDDVGPWLA